ncbi:hypothetical protein TNCV_3866101 [Trichonephila clavipes]|nr:hypothetical protein TNCV_3866101 [Trichonephila clavipes]
MRGRKAERPVPSNQASTRRPCPYYLRSRMKESDGIPEEQRNIEINGIPHCKIRRSLSMEALDGDPWLGWQVVCLQCGWIRVRITRKNFYIKASQRQSQIQSVSDGGKLRIPVSQRDVQRPPNLYYFVCVSSGTIEKNRFWQISLNKSDEKHGQVL